MTLEFIYDGNNAAAYDDGVGVVGCVHSKKAATPTQPLDSIVNQTSSNFPLYYTAIHLLYYPLLIHWLYKNDIEKTQELTQHQPASQQAIKEGATCF